jgi:hypothetical protein
MSERLSSRAGIILVRKLDYTGRWCFTSKSGIKTGESILICDLHRTGSRSNTRRGGHNVAGRVGRRGNSGSSGVSQMGLLGILFDVVRLSVYAKLV